MKRQANYDKKVKVTRILLSDYLVLKRMGQAAGVSMAEALHLLIEHQAQSPMLDMAIKPISAFQVTGMPAVGVTGKPAIQVTGKPAIRVAPVTAIATNGSKAAAFRIKTGRVKYE
ncbi:unnamed protein product [marine sediment metagenome]|uniref:Uncharacterized protein n=1 Tax=marine sediment metagenome TaxID=412755 RepID=X1QL30_9ZZZZ